MLYLKRISKAAAIVEMPPHQAERLTNYMPQLAADANNMQMSTPDRGLPDHEPNLCR
jgi:hypothetical protein